MIILGGVIPKKDYVFLKEIGVEYIFGPGSNIADSASQILNKLLS